MSTYTSEVQICNSALIKLGLDTISSLSDTNKRAKFCDLQYPILRDEVLYSHPWNFAVVRKELAQSATTPAFGYDYEFVLPSDLLRVLNVNENDDGSIAYAIEYDVTGGNRVLRTNEEAIKILYVRRQTDVTQFTPGFGEALALRLAADLAMPLQNSRTQAELWFGVYNQFLSSARSFDAQEGSVQRVITSTWKNARL